MKVVAYIRTATKEEDLNNVENQRNKIVEFCEKNKKVFCINSDMDLSEINK